MSDRKCPDTNKILRPLRFIAILMACYFVANSVHVALLVRTKKGAETLVSSDSSQYLTFSREFLKGDFSMHYIHNVPHREPLYPLLLAIATKLGAGNLFFLGEVNVVAMTLAIGSVYYGILRFWSDHLIAGLATMCFSFNLFFWRLASARLLTEPLYALFLVWVIISFLQYLQSRKIAWLFAGAFFSGLEVLTRPSGVFDAAALLGILFIADLSRRSENKRFLLRAVHQILPYFCAALLFILAAVPAWLPRLIYFGNPFYTGYLTNFLWVDTYHLAHDVDERFPNYTWRDYVSSHNAFQVIERIGHGIWNVCIRIPITDEKIPVLYVLCVGGIWITIRKGPVEYRLLLVLFAIQLFPFIWTNLANPTRRVPYGSTFPFEPFFAARFLAVYRLRISQIFTRLLPYQFPASAP
ncbi:MAG: glycosyltransferase family 39 protein [Verrucomicrobia bacterium]|nr:glycosyltransferase family 39 protein [Verrucomicrobiota bacterium]